MKNRCSEFSIPIIATATATVVRNGSISRVSSVVSSSFPGTPANSLPDAMAWVIGPAKMMPRTTSDAGDDEQRVDDEIAEAPGALAALRGQRGRERRHERGRHRPFGEQIPQQVRHAERDVEGVHFGPARRTEDRGQHRFAGDTKDAARHRGDADQARRAGHSRAHLGREKAVPEVGNAAGERAHEALSVPHRIGARFFRDQDACSNSGAPDDGLCECGTPVRKNVSRHVVSTKKGFCLSTEA